jgi:hypothetical protein
MPKGPGLPGPFSFPNALHTTDSLDESDII